ncbi:MAG: hypothetical protein ACRDZ9_05760 [Acidimicrobiales bacterium]
MSGRARVDDGVFGGVVAPPGVVDRLRAAVAAPVHAYLLVGPPGAGARAGAVAFAAALLCPRGGCGSCRDCRLVLAGEHPDARTFVPDGAYLRVRDAEEIARLALRSPVEGRRKVLVLTEFHRVRDVGPALLKTVEEPPASTVFVILADAVPPELVTIASRCVRIEVPPLAPSTVAEVLVGEGMEPDRASGVARAALGDLDRARVLATDEDLASRHRAWRDAPDRLDGTGAAVAVVAAGLLGRIEEATAPLRSRHGDELAQLEARVSETGERGSGRKRLEAAHRQALRRHRTDELRFGLATLAVRYRDEMVAAAPGREVAGVVDRIGAVHAAAEALVRNPNEELLLQALLLRLSP